MSVRLQPQPGRNCKGFDIKFVTLFDSNEVQKISDVDTVSISMSDVTKNESKETPNNLFTNVVPNLDDIKVKQLKNCAVKLNPALLKCVLIKVDSR